jgi:sec-independent protein translocase protein TatA
MLAPFLSPNVTLATFGNLFGGDAIFIFVLILIFFGAKKLPELARSLGQAMREFSKAKDDFEREITRPPESEKPKQIEAPVPEAPVPPVTKAEEDHPDVTVHPVTTEHPDVTVHPPETVPKH